MQQLSSVSELIDDGEDGGGGVGDCGGVGGADAGRE